MSPSSPGVDVEAAQLFGKNLARAKAAFGDPETFFERYTKQKQQMETLVALETEFRKALIAHSQGNFVYRRFVTFICEEKRNILAARPYFRERQKLFTDEISKALKKRNEKTLYKFQFNFQFVLFAMRCRQWKPKSPITRLYKRINALRSEIVVTNIPLALNRARLFFSKTPTAHLSHMDLVDIACEGLMSGVDKYCLPFGPNFVGMVIGRITGNEIEAYSETLLHFFPRDKRIIYRGNKFVGKHVDGADFERLSKEVNHDVSDSIYKTTPDELASLMAASSCVSADTGTVRGMSGSSSASDGAGAMSVNVPKLVDRFEAPEDTRPDVRVEAHEALTTMHAAIATLTPLEQKFLRLRGVTAAPPVL